MHLRVVGLVLHGGTRHAPVPDRCLHQADHPGEAADRLLGRAPSRRPAARRTPRSTARRASRAATRAVGRRPSVGVRRARAASSASRCRRLRGGERRVVAACAARAGTVDTYSRIRAVTSATSSSASPARSTPASSSKRCHHRVAQLALVGEVPVDRALVDAGALGDGAHRERAPVPDGEAVQQLGAGGEDALARLGRALAADRAVVAPARRCACRSRAHGTTTGSVSQPRTVEVGASCGACRQSTSHSGNRLSTSSSATRPSSRASAAPRQKWMP